MTVIGTLIGDRFRIEERVGSGGMSTVYLAWDPTLERWVAIKLMHRDISSDPDQLERFRREARAVAQLNHPHVVTVIDAGEDDGTPYIVFEYIEGETLNDPDGRAKVTDFGIARSMEAQGLTATGRVLGTTDYVSPEQALGHEVTEQSDIYSLGIVLYEMLTGEAPFQADTQVAVAMKHVREPMPDAQRRRPEISATLAAVVERATAKETQNRYATVEDMVHDLEEVLAIEAARTGQATGEATTVLRSLSDDTADFAPQRLRHPRRTLFLSVAVLAIVAGAIAYFATRTEKGPGRAATPSTPGLSAVTLSKDAAHDYDPEGDGEESRGQVRVAIDGLPTTVWDTETYDGGFEASNKTGVGLYVSAGSRVAARQLDVNTSTPGFTTAVYASDSVPSRLADWDKVSITVTAKREQQIQLDTAKQGFRNYLLWISKLPEGGRVTIKEL